MNFEEGWRIWRLGIGPLGAPQLGPPLSDNTYTLPAVWDGNTAMAQCILGCTSLPGPECRCGLRFYPHTEGFVRIAEGMAARRTDELLHHWPGYWEKPAVISYGVPVGPCYPDPKTGLHGSWRQYWRTGRYEVLALLGWPEYPMQVLGARYGGIPTFSLDTMPPSELLERVASSVRQA
ncbi:hypothetical protein [Mycobacteroides chelonae]|uniref:hypothetical protein n=1 Tax=Mycobacteroides chelonae TaxID=1774 RepID=UPI0032047D54